MTRRLRPGPDHVSPTIIAVLLAFFLIVLGIAAGGNLLGVLPILVTVLGAGYCLIAAPACIGMRRLGFAGWCLLLFIAVTLLPLPSLPLRSPRSRAFWPAAADIVSFFQATGMNDVVAEVLPAADQRLLPAAATGAAPGTRLDRMVPGAQGRRDGDGVRGLATSARLTLNKAGTLRFFFLAVGSWVVFWIVVSLPVRGRVAFARAMVVGGTLVVAASVVGQWWIPQGRALLWLIEIPYGKSIGPFVNRNHFALFCALLLPVSLCLAASPSAGLDAVDTANAGSVGRVGRAAGSAGRILVFGSCAAILVAGILTSLSRGGFLAAFAGVVTVVLLFLRIRHGAFFIVTILVFSLVIGVMLWPRQEVHERLGSLREASDTLSARMRFQMWHDALAIWRDHPLVGAGFDSFRTVYPLYKRSASRKTALHCENEYIQLLADGGGLGAGFWLVVLLSYMTLLVRGQSRSLGRLQESLLPVASLGVFSVAAVHGMFDFGLRIPVNAMVLAGFLGLAMPVRPAVSGDSSGVADSAVSGGPARWLRARLPRLVMLVVVVSLASVSWRSAWERDRPAYLSKSSTRELLAAVNWTPTYWYTWFELGRRCFAVGGEIRRVAGAEDPLAAAFYDRGLACFRRAQQYNANDYNLQLAMAELEHALGNEDEARQAAERVIALRPYLKARVVDYLGEPGR